MEKKQIKEFKKEVKKIMKHNSCCYDDHTIIENKLKDGFAVKCKLYLLHNSTIKKLIELEQKYKHRFYITTDYGYISIRFILNQQQ